MKSGSIEVEAAEASQPVEVRVLVSEYEWLSDYPKLMVRPTTGMIVLFTQPKHGTVLYPGSAGREVAQVVEWDDMCGFEEFDGIVKIKNADRF